MYVEGDKGTGRFGFTVGVLLEGGCLTCEELVGVLTGDDGVGFRGVIFL